MSSTTTYQSDASLPSPSWKIEGDYFEGCNCDVICPCTIWKENKDRWYIVESEDRRISNIEILNTLTPRQFQDAIDKGEYSFEW